MNILLDPVNIRLGRKRESPWPTLLYLLSRAPPLIFFTGSLVMAMLASYHSDGTSLFISQAFSSGYCPQHDC